MVITNLPTACVWSAQGINPSLTLAISSHHDNHALSLPCRMTVSGALSPSIAMCLPSSPLHLCVPLVSRLAVALRGDGMHWGVGWAGGVVEEMKGSLFVCALLFWGHHHIYSSFSLFL